jgi:hypothetical protein
MAINSVALGTNSVIGVGALGQTLQGTFDAIGGKVSGTMTIEHEEVDTTNCDDVGFKSHLLGTTTITLSVEARFDPVDDTAQGVIELVAADLDNGGGTFKALKAWQVLPNGNNSNESEFTFDGYISSFELNPGEVDAPVNVSFEVKGVGASIATTAPAYGTIP